MSRIYSQSHSTIVWLCDDQDRYPLIAQDFNRTGSRKVLSDLLADPYFTRLWIVQEVFLASHVRVLVEGSI